MKSCTVRGSGGGGGPPPSQDGSWKRLLLLCFFFLRGWLPVMRTGVAGVLAVPKGDVTKSRVLPNSFFAP